MAYEDLAKGADQLLKGLAYLHENNIQHGDLKAQNILLVYEEDMGSDDAEGRLLMHIADFGGSRKFDENFSNIENIEDLPPITATHSIRTLPCASVICR